MKKYRHRKPKNVHPQDEDISVQSTSKSLSEKNPSNHDEEYRSFSTFQAQVFITKQILRSPSHIIVPDSKYIFWWDLIVLSALLFTALITPYEVALLKTTIGGGLFIANRIIDFIFVKDMIINFFLSYWEENESSGTWVKDLKKIQKRYLKGWFWIDLVSIFPFDLLQYISRSRSVTKLQFIKVVRVLRLLKMVRVLKASRIYRRLESEVTLSFSAQSLIKFTMMVLFGGHWLACLWCMVGILERENGNANWISTFLDSDDTGTIGNAENMNHIIVYSAALYFAIMTISSIGYGDITPCSASERWICIWIMLCGSAVWAYVIGNAAGIVATMDVDGIHFHQTMDNLNDFLRDQRFSSDLSQKMRAYFHSIRHLMKTRRNQTLVNELSPQLRDTVAVRKAQWVKKVPWAVGLSNEFVAALVQSMQGTVFSPYEVMPSLNHLCVVNRGLATLQGSVLSKGSYYGMDIILQSTFLKQKAPARSLTFTELLFIERTNFLELLYKFRKDAKRIRRHALHLALRRAMILIYTFSKCGWKFHFAETQIPYVAPQSINQAIGEKYEKFVHSLHPKLSEENVDIQQLMRSTEKQEQEEGNITELLGSPLHSSRHHLLRNQHFENQLDFMGKHVKEINSRVLNYINYMDELLLEFKSKNLDPTTDRNDKMLNPQNDFAKVAIQTAYFSLITIQFEQKDQL